MLVLAFVKTFRILVSPSDSMCHNPSEMAATCYFNCKPQFLKSSGKFKNEHTTKNLEESVCRCRTMKGGEVLCA